MASTYTQHLRVEQPNPGEFLNEWGPVANRVFEVFDEAIAGVTNLVTTGGAHTLTAVNGSSDEARKAILIVSGALTSSAVFTLPTGSKKYTVVNRTTGPYLVTFRAAGTGTSASIAQSRAAEILSDGAGNVIFAGAPVTVGGSVDVSALQPATKAQMGVVQFATDVTAAAGTDDTVPPTVKQMATAITSATTPATALAALLTVDGAGSGLDADRIDGLN